MAKEAPDALTLATKLLAGRDKTRAQLALALERKGHPPEVIAATLTRLGSLGYLDDARVAHRRALEDLRAGWAGEALQARLDALGLDAALAAQAIDAAVAELGWSALAMARTLLERRKLTGAKAARFLGARGFPEDVVERLVGSAGVER